MWSTWFWGRVDSKRFLVDSCASTVHAYFVFPLDCLIPLAAVSTLTTKILLDVFHFILWTAWNQSMKSDKQRSTWFQQSSKRRSCNTPKFVCVALVTSMYFSGNWECFFVRHVELNSTFNVMTISEVTLDRPKVLPGFSVIVRFCRLRPLRVSTKVSSEIFAP